ncbi:MAG: DUF3501 family protein [Pseudomonadota bacterium]
MAAAEKLSRSDLMTLERYAEERPSFRQRVIQHKALRRIALGPHVTLMFEDRLTIQYQIQEMLRVERIFDAAGIEEELDAYNPLIPDGQNLKATMLIEYPDVEQRKTALARMPGVEHKVWLQVDDHEQRFAIANEDLDRSNDEKTAAVHFMRFELTSEDIAALRNQSALRIGIDHPELPHTVELSPESRAALTADFG